MRASLKLEKKITLPCEEALILLKNEIFISTKQFLPEIVINPLSEKKILLTVLFNNVNLAFSERMKALEIKDILRNWVLFILKIAELDKEDIGLKNGKRLFRKR